MTKHFRLAKKDEKFNSMEERIMTLSYTYSCRWYRHMLKCIAGASEEQRLVGAEKFDRFSLVDAHGNTNLSLKVKNKS